MNLFLAAAAARFSAAYIGRITEKKHRASIRLLKSSTHQEFTLVYAVFEFQSESQILSEQDELKTLIPSKGKVVSVGKKSHTSTALPQRSMSESFATIFFDKDEKYNRIKVFSPR